MKALLFNLTTAATLLASPAARAEGGWLLQMDGIPTADASYTSVSMVDDQRVWLLGGNSIYFSSDGGASWTEVNDPDGPQGIPAEETGGTISAIDETSAVVTTTTGAIYRTSDRGGTWLKVFQDASVTSFFNSSQMFDAASGYAMGDAPNQSSPVAFLTTSDGGWTWTPVTTNLPLGCNQYAGPTSSFVNPSAGWSVQLVPTSPTTYRRKVFKTTDGGATWTVVDSTLTSYSLFFVNESVGYLTSAYTEKGVHRTTDGGATWEYVLDYAEWAFIRGCPGGNRVWTGGGGVGSNNTTIKVTDDGGETWYDQDVPTPDGGYLWNASFVSQDIGFIVGIGTVVATTTGGNPVTHAVSGPPSPARYSLSQNYPNPFNPSTTIEYTLPQAGHVRLSIYTVLGQELATLVAGEHAAGTFRTLWNATQLPGGVYLIRLSTEEQTITRKALLLK